MEVEPEISFNEGNFNDNGQEIYNVNTSNTLRDVDTNMTERACSPNRSTVKSPEMCSDMGDDVSVMVQNILKSRPEGMSPLQCSECDLECPSLSALQFHTQLHVMERMVQSSYKYPEIGLKRATDKNSKRKSKENKNVHVDEARDMKTMMESLVSDAQGTSVELDKIKVEIKSEDEKPVKRNLRKRKSKKTFKCKECNRKFKSKENLETHKLKHTDLKLFSCTQCSHTCSKITQLTRHMLTHSTEKRHACPLCEYRCNDKGNLSKHLLTHGDAKPFSCPEENCDYKCKFKCNLKSHMLKHTGERPFACHLCEYRSIDKNGLTTHMFHHSGERPFPCTVCGKKYASKSNLKVHMRIHTDDKKFKCEHCDYRFFTQSKLDTHVRTHTGEKPYECLECGHRFTSSSNLNKHMKTHFGGTKPRQRKPSKPKEITINVNSLTTINVNSLAHPLYVPRIPNKSFASEYNLPQTVGSSQLPYDLSQHSQHSQHSEVSNDSSQVHHHFNQGNAHSLNNQHILGSNSIMGRNSQHTTLVDVHHKNDSNYASPTKQSWHQGNSSNQAVNVDEYNYQTFIDKLLHTRQQVAGENYSQSQVPQNYSLPNLAPLHSQPEEHTHLNSKLPSTVQVQPNMSELMRHANYMYNIQ